MWEQEISMTTKNAGKLLAILITMQMWQYDAGCIAQWSTSRALLEATGCCHWMSAYTVLPRRLSWLAIFGVRQKNTYKTQLYAS
jgi:hypothetical protein